MPDNYHLFKTFNEFWGRWHPNDYLPIECEYLREKKLALYTCCNKDGNIKIVLAPPDKDYKWFN
jgi:hypothetical protein